jgi:Cu-Zn family superoxide dismutase
MTGKTTQNVAILLLAGAALTACENGDSKQGQSEHELSGKVSAANVNHKKVTEIQATQSEGIAKFALIDSATVEIEPKSGSSVSGTVVFSPGSDMKSMQVDIALSGLEPGKHGVHIHELDDCSAEDASSAGGHFNPFNNEHGAPLSDSHHLGDMGNVEANSEGDVRVTLMLDDMSFSGPNSILQRSVVVHAEPDDLTSAPAGNAGKRIGCGEIMQDRESLTTELFN